jgi:phosphotransferase system HPr (HPr) family protein
MKEPKTIIATAVLQNTVGLHARPAALFVQIARKFQSSIRVRRDHMEGDGKSILDVLSLGAEHGTTITLMIEGHDAEMAAKALVDLINGKFGEN